MPTLMLRRCTLLLGLLSIVFFTGCSESISSETVEKLPATAKEREALYVGSTVCMSCHIEQGEAWKDSHHALAMQPANTTTVLGDFNDSRFEYYGQTSRFFRKDKQFMVNTDGTDGKLADFEIKYTFGLYPLQQYLIELPGGKMQALSIAWDSRPKEQGGQRWFHMYPDEAIRHNDLLHWTKLGQNWNFMCADCHSTGLRKAYDLPTKTFHTRWREISVGCEACHGAGAKHTDWAKQRQAGQLVDTPDPGLPVPLKERQGVTWSLNLQTGHATRSTPRVTNIEIETCAACHARRSPLLDGSDPGQPLLERYRVALLSDGLYHADGQMHDEVYNYASFLQSKMYQSGVTCSDCHDPHSIKPRAKGNAVCAQCHLPSKFDTPDHHFHAKDSSGASCMACHAPTTTYMVVDPRHDHSFRIPRPDLTVKLGTPNACSQCHQDQTPEWAATTIERWYAPHPKKGFQTYAETLQAARGSHPRAGQWLAALAQDGNAPNIARATALAELQNYLNPQALPALREGLAHHDPLLREATLRSLIALPIKVCVALAAPLLNDPVLGVRIEAARLLVTAADDLLSTEQQTARQKALQEYIAVQKANTDRPEYLVNLGVLARDQGNLVEAERYYQAAIAVEPLFTGSYVNLADLYREQGRDAEGERVLRAGLAQDPKAADLYYALGLLNVRRKNLDAAIEALAKAVANRPEQTQFSYVYAIALEAAGRLDEALAVLEQSLLRQPKNQQLLEALIAFNRKAGKNKQAITYGQRLQEAAGEEIKGTR